MSPFAHLAADLDALQRIGRRRRLEGRAGLDFTSNDYLGLANADELREAAAEALARHVPVGAGGSRSLRGNHPEHEALEETARRYFGSETALYFVSGYAANVALFATAPQRGDLVIHDERVHASVYDGLRRCRAHVVGAPHSDTEFIRAQLVRWRNTGGKGLAWIAVESVYSMDGDGPDLQALATLVDEFGAVLVIDEAHATGVLGPTGRGRAAFLEGRANVISIHTCGKALGTAGAFVCGPAVVTDFLINRGRPFIYGTAPSPLVASVTRAAIELCARSDARRQRLQRLVDLTTRCLSHYCGLESSGSHIVPIVIGEDEATVDLAARLRRRGYDVRAIRPPTVPAGTARLRVALTLNVDEAAVEGLVRTLGEELGKGR